MIWFDPGFPTLLEAASPFRVPFAISTLSGGLLLAGQGGRKPGLSHLVRLRSCSLPGLRFLPCGRTPLRIRLCRYSQNGRASKEPVKKTTCRADFSPPRQAKVRPTRKKRSYKENPEETPASGSSSCSTQGTKERDMELGMIGLGRMGNNMVRRLLRAGHACVVYDLHAEAVQALVQEGAVGTTSLADFVQKLSRPRAVWMMVPAAAVDPTLEALVPLLERDDAVIDGGNSHYHDDIRRAAELRARGIHYLDVGTSGGVWGMDRGYCLMIGGDAGGRAASRPDLRGPGPRHRDGPAHAGAGEDRRHRRAGLPALRAGRRRPLRQDGPQRDRVRRDGRLRRGAEHSPPRQRRQAAADRRCRDHAAPPPRALSIRPGPGRHRRGLAPRQRDRLLAAGLDRAGPAGQPGPGGLQGPGFRFRRGPLDGHGGHRRVGPGAGDQRRALRSFQLAGRGRFRRQGALRDASAPSAATWKRPPLPREATHDRLAFRRAGALRRDRRSGPQDDLPGTVCDGQARRPEGPGHRRRRPELEPGRISRSRAGQHQAIGRDRRPARARPSALAVQLRERGL